MASIVEKSRAILIASAEICENGEKRMRRSSQIAHVLMFGAAMGAVK
jgi:hypothetical protein